MPNQPELSPEEKLLRLIRDSGKKNPKEKQPAAIVQSKEPVPEKISKPNRLHPQAKIIFSGIKSINFVLINRLIILITFCAVVLFVYDLYFNQQEIPESAAVSKSGKKISPVKEREIKPFSYYQQEIAKRNLFKTGPQDAEAKKAAPAGATFKELVKDLQILGIVSTGNPQVIIEDKKLQKTHFLYAGDYLGEIKVEEIHPDRVVLEFKGEEITLYL